MCRCANVKFEVSTWVNVFRPWVMVIHSPIVMSPASSESDAMGETDCRRRWGSICDLGWWVEPQAWNSMWHSVECRWNFKTHESGCQRAWVVLQFVHGWGSEEDGLLHEELVVVGCWHTLRFCVKKGTVTISMHHSYCSAQCLLKVLISKPAGTFIRVVYEQLLSVVHHGQPFWGNWILLGLSLESLIPTGLAVLWGEMRLIKYNWNTLIHRKYKCSWSSWWGFSTNNKLMLHSLHLFSNERVKRNFT